MEAAGRRIGVEVKAGPRRNVCLSRAARSFIEAARPNLFLVLQPGESMEREHDGCRVVFTRAAELGALLRGDI